MKNEKHTVPSKIPTGFFVILITPLPEEMGGVQ